MNAPMRGTGLHELLAAAPASPSPKAASHAVAGYEPLAAVLAAAYNQAACGKGKERHAVGGTPFAEQPMSMINDMLGSIDGFLYQAMKKATEAKRLPPERAVAELLGAINYLAGAVMKIERDGQRT